jgi:sugar O-acyltransferase (sialic acid O-acetyltransferase NeuD family)
MPQNNITNLCFLHMSNKHLKLAIIGSSGHSRAALDVALQMDAFNFVGWIESYKTAGEFVDSYPILGHPDDISELCSKFHLDTIFIGISNNLSRKLVWEKIHAAMPELKPVSLIHPMSYISPSAHVDRGTLVMGGAIINSGCNVGAHCIVNTNASLDHDSVLKPFASILPGVCTGGNVSIGECSCVCLGTTISHGLNIGSNSYIGAGSLVLNDIPSEVLAYGIPAKVVRSRNISEKHF